MEICFLSDPPKEVLSIVYIPMHIIKNSEQMFTSEQKSKPAFRRALGLTWPP